MARSYTYPIIGALLFTAFLVIQLVQSFGIPSLNFAQFKGLGHLHDAFPVDHQDVHMSADDLRRASEVASDGSTYLLGAGKGDITG